MDEDANDYEADKLILEFGAARKDDTGSLNAILERLSRLSLVNIFNSDTGILLRHHLRNALSNPLTIVAASQACASLLTLLDAPFLSTPVENLGDPNPQTRKYSHLFLLECVRSHKSTNLVSSVFLESGFKSTNVQIKQKSINSFQGIIIQEPSCIDWESQETLSIVICLLNIWQKEPNVNVQKAADHTLVSLCKLDQMRNIIPKLAAPQLNIIQSVAEKHLIIGLLPQNLENASSILIKHKKQVDPQQHQQKQQYSEKQEQNETFLGKITPQTRTRTQQSPPGKEYNSHKNESQNRIRFGILTEKQFEDLRSLKDWRNKALAVEQLEKTMQQAGADFPMLIPSEELPDFLTLMLDLTSDANFKVQVTSLTVVQQIVHLPKCDLDAMFLLISQSMIEQLGDTKIATFKNDQWIGVLLSSLNTRNPQLREEILTVLEVLINQWMNSSQPAKSSLKRNSIKSSYSPSDWRTIVNDLSPFLKDPREKVRQKCLDCMLAVYSSLATSEDFLDFIQENLSKEDESIILRAINGFSNHQEPSSTTSTSPSLPVPMNFSFKANPQFEQKFQPRLPASKPQPSESIRQSRDLSATATMPPRSQHIPYAEQQPIGSQTVSNSFQKHNIPVSASKMTTSDPSSFTDSLQRQIAYDQQRIPSGKQTKQSSNYSSDATSSIQTIHKSNHQIDPIFFPSDHRTTPPYRYDQGQNKFNINTGSNVSTDGMKTLDRSTAGSMSMSPAKQVGLNLMNTRDFQAVGKNIANFAFDFDPHNPNLIIEDKKQSYQYHQQQSANKPSIASSTSSSNSSSYASTNAASKGIIGKIAVNNNSNNTNNPAIQSKGFSAQKAPLNPTDFFEDQAYQSYSYKPPPAPPVFRKTQSHQPQSSASKERDLIELNSDEERQKEMALTHLRQKKLQTTVAPPQAQNTALPLPPQRYTSERPLNRRPIEQSQTADSITSTPPPKSTQTYIKPYTIQRRQVSQGRQSFDGDSGFEDGSRYPSEADIGAEDQSPNPTKKFLKSGLNAEGNNYTNEKDLEPLRNPENAISTIIKELKSGDWERQFKGLDLIRRLIKFHSDILSKSTQFTQILKEVNGFIDNLRSSLAKNAMMTIGEMGWKLKRQVEVELEGSFSKLMKKGMDANAFILEEVKSAFFSLASNCTPSKILSLCFMQNTKSQQSKQYVIHCFSTLISVHGDKLLQLKEFDRIIEYLAGYSVDSAADVRKFAKNALVDIIDNRIIDSNRLRTLLLRTKDENTVNKIMNGLTSSTSGSGPSAASMTSISPFSRQNSTAYSRQSNNATLSKTLRSQQPRNSQPSMTDFDDLDRKSDINSATSTSIYGKSMEKVSRSSIKGGISEALQQDLQTLMTASESSDWTARLNALTGIEKVVQGSNAMKELNNSRVLSSFLDMFTKLNTDSNLKVQLRSLEVFGTVVPILADNLNSGIQSILNSIFTACSSQNSGVKRQAEEVFDIIMRNVDSSYLFEPLNNGAIFANPKSKPILISHLASICEEISKKKSTIFSKNISKTIVKLLQENKSELKPALKKLLKEVYEILEEDLFLGPLSTYRTQIYDILK